MSSRARNALIALGLAALLGLAACPGKLDERGFRREAEQAYVDVSPGWTIFRREEQSTVFVRGDQLDRLDTAALFADYQKSGLSGSDFFEGWTAQKRKEAEARRHTLEQAEAEVVPILKSGSWMRVQDLGAIGPKQLQNKIRPWRHSIAPDLFVVLGVPEEKLGFRFASLEEVSQSKRSEKDWLDLAIANLDRRIGTSTGTEMMSGDHLLVLDMDNKDGISGLVLSPAFRARMLKKFKQAELGAAIPLRNVLVLFDSTDPVYRRPVRARAHQLYDSQNHPAFRGLLRLDADSVTVLEPATPERPTTTEVAP